MLKKIIDIERGLCDNSKYNNGLFTWNTEILKYFGFTFYIQTPGTIILQNPGIYSTGFNVENSFKGIKISPLISKVVG